MGVNNNGSGQTKADLIIAKVNGLDSKVGNILAETQDRAMDREAILLKLNADTQEILQELQYLSVQQTSVYKGVDKNLGALSGKVEEAKEAAASAQVELDYDALADKVAERLTLAPQEIDYDTLADKVAERLSVAPKEIDYDELAARVAQNLYIPSAVVEDIDYDALAEKVAGKIVVNPEIDYDVLAAKVKDAIPDEAVSPDYIASKVAEQMVIPSLDEDALAEKIASKIYVDTDEISKGVAEKFSVPAAAEQYDIMADEEGCAVIAKAITDKLDLDAVAAAVAEKINASLAVSGDNDVDTEELAKQLSEKIVVENKLDEEAIADKAAAALSNYITQVDTDEIADKVVAGLIPAIPAPAEVNTDEVAEKVVARIDISEFNPDEIADRVAERITIPEYNADEVVDKVAERIVVPEYNADEVADKVAERITVPELNTDEVALKVAELVAPAEVNTDEVANKVADRVIPAIPATVGATEIIGGVVDRLADRKEDFDIVLDEDGLQKVTAAVAESLKGEYAERFDKVDSDIEEIKKMLATGIVTVAAASEIAPAEAVEEEELVTVSDLVEEEAAEEEPAPVSETAEEEPAEEELVTVSDLVDEEAVEEEPVPEVAGEELDEEVIEEISEQPAEAEIEEAEAEDLSEQAEQAEGEEGETANGGVDFLSMMKYNRSFIARIIQGTDEQKQYYGQVKNALLSYKKVNSNIAWGAERFNKGRETIARFKIRGKTLCLYLALDPNEFATSVYHHADVSDNKSLNGTPMMVKIKSPLGAKKAIRLIDIMLEKRNGIKQNVVERDYAAMYPYETIEELIDDGLVKDVRK